MNKILIKATLLSSFLVISTAANAQSTHGNRYVGANLGFFTLEAEGVSDKAHLSTIDARVGGFFNDFVAGELRAGFGLVGDEIGISGSNIDVDLKYIFGGYIRAGAPLNDKFFPYVLFGYSRAELDYSGSTLSDNGAETDTSYGIGVDFHIVNMSLNIEYASLLDQKGAEVSGVSVGFTTNF